MVNISIIIPVFNAEKYLEKCLNSCLNQTLKDIEIIVVDDASTDKSADILRRFAQLYPNKIRCIYLEKNMKQGGARNRAIRIAKGEYLCFVDSDDYIDSQMCEKLYRVAKRNNDDIVCCDGYDVYNEGKVVYREDKKEYDIKHLNFIGNFTGQCFMIIHKNIIIKNDLFYPEGIIYEDASIVPLWFLKSIKREKVNLPFYYRVINFTSTTKTESFEYCLQILKSINLFYEKSIKMDIYRKYKKSIDTYILLRIRAFIRKIIDGNYVISNIDIKSIEESIANIRKINFDNNCYVGVFTAFERLIVQNFLNSPSDLENWHIESEIFMKKNTFWGFDDIDDRILDLFQYLEKECKRKIVVWGVGNRGRILISALAKLRLSYIVVDGNENKWNERLDTGDIVKNYAELDCEYSQYAILVTPTLRYTEIRDRIKSIEQSTIVVDIFLYLREKGSVENFLD